MNIQETEVWQDGIYLIDINDPVQGGENGVDNLPHKQLANRTKFLKKQVDEQEIKINELQNTIQGLKNTDNSGLQSQIDVLKQLIQNANSATKTETVAYIQFSMIGTSSQQRNILTEIDKIGDIAVEEISNPHSPSARVVKVKLPDEFRKLTHRYIIHVQPLPYDNDSLEGTTYYTIKSDSEGVLIINFRGSNTLAAYQSYVSMMMTIEVKQK